jgi:hypothetical protein
MLEFVTLSFCSAEARASCPTGSPGDDTPGDQPQQYPGKNG